MGIHRRMPWQSLRENRSCLLNFFRKAGIRFDMNQAGRGLGMRLEQTQVSDCLRRRFLAPLMKSPSLA
jgi:hypothetical protein